MRRRRATASSTTADVSQRRTLGQGLQLRRHQVHSAFLPSACEIYEVGRGACEIRVRDRAGQFRVIYVATPGTVVYVLHAFQKKSRKTPKGDLELARLRYREATEMESER